MSRRREFRVGDTITWASDNASTGVITTILNNSSNTELWCDEWVGRDGYRGSRGFIWADQAILVKPVEVPRKLAGVAKFFREKVG